MEPSPPAVDDVHRLRRLRLSPMRHRDHRAAGTDPRTLSRAVERAQAHAAAAHVLAGVGSGDGVGDERLHDVTGHAGIPPRKHLHALVVLPRDEHVGGVVRVGGEDIRADARSAARHRREVGPDGLATEPELLHEVLLERHGVEPPRVGVSVLLGPRAGGGPGAEGEELPAGRLGDRRIRQLRSHRIDDQPAGTEPELGPEVVGGGRPSAEVRRRAHRQLAGRSRPFLVVERARLDADGGVELGQERPRQRRKEHGGGLRRHQVLAAHLELVSSRQSAEDRVILEDQARPGGSGAAREEERGGQAADPSSHDHAIERSCILDVARGHVVVHAVPDLVPLGEDRERVAVGARVIPDAAVAVEVGVTRGQELQRRGRAQEGGARGEECRVQEVAASEGHRHSA